MTVLRFIRNGTDSIFALLFAIMLLGCYSILFSNKLGLPATELSQEHLENKLEESGAKRISVVNYEPVFEKYYDKYYGTSIVKRFWYSDAKPKTRQLEYKTANQDNAEDAKFNEIWKRADSMISANGLFGKKTEGIVEILDALATAKIVAVDVLDVGEYESGTSEKWIGILQGGQKVVIKLMWEDKGQPKPGGLCNYGYEMPWAEIVGFHVHKVLDFRNTPCVAGRRVDIRREILPVASPRVAKKIEQGIGKQVCIVGKCHYCTKENRLCPSDGIVEVSIAYWIPRHLDLFTWYPEYMPWSTPRMDEWREIAFNNRTYCNKVRKEMEPYSVDGFYYDLFDFSVIDTLMYHFDSKHYVISDNSDAHGLTIRLDHGRAFCRFDEDDEEIFLAPLYQCCTLRRSTYNKLMRYRERTTLFSSQLQQSLTMDRLAPFLSKDWYATFERRLGRIFAAIDKCAKANGSLDKVLVNS